MCQLPLSPPRGKCRVRKGKEVGWNGGTCSPSLHPDLKCWWQWWDFPEGQHFCPAPQPLVVTKAGLKHPLSRCSSLLLPSPARFPEPLAPFPAVGAGCPWVAASPSTLTSTRSPSRDSTAMADCPAQSNGRARAASPPCPRQVVTLLSMALGLGWGQRGTCPHVPQRCVVAWVWQRHGYVYVPVHIHTYTLSFPTAELGYKKIKPKPEHKERSQIALVPWTLLVKVAGSQRLDANRGVPQLCCMAVTGPAACQ